jgi:hypothetical protein
MLKHKHMIVGRKALHVWSYDQKLYRELCISAATATANLLCNVDRFISFMVFLVDFEYLPYIFCIVPDLLVCDGDYCSKQDRTIPGHSDGVFDLPWVVNYRDITIHMQMHRPVLKENSTNGKKKKKRKWELHKWSTSLHA